MAYATKISNAMACTMLNAGLALLNGGYVEVRSGTKPADPSVAVSDGLLIGTLGINATAFQNAVDTNPDARATANALTPDSAADNTAAPTWFRAYTSGGVAVIDGTAGTAGTDMIVSVATVAANSILSATSWVVNHPE